MFSRKIRLLSFVLILCLAGVGWSGASKPVPADGALHEDTWISLGWTAGNDAASFDVYFGDNLDDVRNGTGDAPRGNQTTTSFIAGFVGFPYPDGLVPGTIYYGRIDEIQTDGTVHEGLVWSFSIPSKKATDPVPADGARFVAADVELSWEPGFGAKLHTVYFGESFDEVDNATGGVPQGGATFTPAGPLQPDKTYYWRVDEFDVAVTHKGDVWSFTVAGAGGGIKGQYYRGMDLNNLMLVRTDPRIDFSWGSGGPDPAVGDDSFSCRWTGEVEAAFTETYTFYTNSDDGVRLWVGGKQLVNNWTDHGNTENQGTIDLVAGQTYSVVMEMYENTGGAVAQLRWSSPRTPKQFVPQAALSHLVRANNPSPANGIVGVKLVSNLTWQPGESAASHEVYLGTDADAVANATKASPQYKGSKQLGEEIFDPGRLAFDTEYFWRIDEVNSASPDSPWIGNTWTFATGPFLVVDDFEPYNDIDPPDPASNRIFESWIDGFGTTTNGALVGNDFPPYAERTIVRSGAQSMPYSFDTDNKICEATLTLDWPRDWTESDVNTLTLSFRGNPSNAAERMFVALNGNAVVYHNDPSATQIPLWTGWNIELKAFADQGVDLANVNTITIGFGTKDTPLAGGSGMMYFDDIRLATAPVPVGRVLLLAEDFEGLELGPNVDESAGTEVWTDTPPPGWVIDESGVPGIGDPATDGVTEWAGWAFTDKEWWTSVAGDQNRSQYTLGQGTVAVADPDEWDDQAHADAAAAGWYKTFMSTPEIDISGVQAGTVELEFDSSWRPEFDSDYHQTANITVSFNGADPIELLLWESDGSSPNFKPDSTNETVVLNLQTPPWATSMVLTFGLFDAGNDWWWAIDNIKISGLAK
jgi:hypothetical protein